MFSEQTIGLGSNEKLFIQPSLLSSCKLKNSLIQNLRKSTGEALEIEEKLFSLIFPGPGKSLDAVSFLPELEGRHSEILPEGLDEIGTAGKLQLFGDFRNRQGFGGEEMPGLFHFQIKNHLRRRFCIDALPMPEKGAPGESVLANQLIQIPFFLVAELNGGCDPADFFFLRIVRLPVFLLLQNQFQKKPPAEDIRLIRNPVLLRFREKRNQRLNSPCS